MAHPGVLRYPLHLVKRREPARVVGKPPLELPPAFVTIKCATLGPDLGQFPRTSTKNKGPAARPAARAEGAGGGAIVFWS